MPLPLLSVAEDEALLATTLGDLSACMKAIQGLIDGRAPLSDVRASLLELSDGLDVLLMNPSQAKTVTDFARAATLRAATEAREAEARCAVHRHCAGGVTENFLDAARGVTLSFCARHALAVRVLMETMTASEAVRRLEQYEAKEKAPFLTITLTYPLRLEENER